MKRGFLNRNTPQRVAAGGAQPAQQSGAASSQTLLATSSHPSVEGDAEESRSSNGTSSRQASPSTSTSSVEQQPSRDVSQKKATSSGSQAETQDLTSRPAPAAQEQRTRSAPAAGAQSMWGGKGRGASQLNSTATSSNGAPPSSAVPTSASAQGQAAPAASTSVGVTPASLSSQPGPSRRTQPTREERTGQASLLPADDDLLLQFFLKRRLPTANYHLPFIAADGRQAIVAMPQEMYPKYRAGTAQRAQEAFEYWDFTFPLDPSDGAPPYVPVRPTYVPGSSNRPAALVDQSSGYIWQVVPYTNPRDKTLPWSNPRKAHYLASPPYWAPPFDPLEIGDGPLPYERTEDAPTDLASLAAHAKARELALRATRPCPARTPGMQSTQADRVRVWQETFNRLAPERFAATQEASFADYHANIAARPAPASQRSSHVRPDRQLPLSRGERPSRALILFPDGHEDTHRELRQGSLLPTIHFQLPFLAADGRRTLIAMPGDCIPCYSCSELGAGSQNENLFLFYDTHGLERPTDPEQRIACPPAAPLFRPSGRSDSDKNPVLLDEGGWCWRLLRSSDLRTSTLPWTNARESHYVAGPPWQIRPFIASEIGDDPLPPWMAGNRHFERRRREAQAAAAAAAAAPRQSGASSRSVPTNGQSTTPAVPPSSQTQQQQSAGDPPNRGQRSQRAQRQQTEQSRPQVASAQPSRPWTQPPPTGQLTRLQIMPADHITDDEALSGVRIPTAHYVLPFSAPDGEPSLVAIPADFVAWLPDAEDADTRGEDEPPLYPYVPTSPYYVPRGGTTDGHIPWLYDSVTGWAWPMLYLSGVDESQLPWRNTRGAHWITGPPRPADYFAEDDTIGPLWAIPPAERPSAMRAESEDYPARINSFLDGLETADAELRARMARLGIGEVGHGNEEGESGPGCPVCLEVFGAESEGSVEMVERRVVVAPCGGWHLYHRSCLSKTLESVHSWRRWACPMCRGKLRDEEGRKKEEEEAAAGVGRVSDSVQTGTAATAAALTAAAAAHKGKAPAVKSAPPTSLREEVRRREEIEGLICEDGACVSTKHGDSTTSVAGDDRVAEGRGNRTSDHEVGEEAAAEGSNGNNGVVAGENGTAAGSGKAKKKKKSKKGKGKAKA